jgi:hypothetical protein
LEDLGVERKIMLKLTLKEWNGRPMCREEDNVKTDLKGMEWETWV